MDLTGEARFVADSDDLVVSGDRFVSGRKAGTGSITVTAGGRTLRVPVTIRGVAAPPVGFVREIEPVLNRVELQPGHLPRLSQGKNGFKLSLRDTIRPTTCQALIRDLSGRRFNRVAVDESLMLQSRWAMSP